MNTRHLQYVLWHISCLLQKISSDLAVNTVRPLQNSPYIVELLMDVAPAEINKDMPFESCPLDRVC